MKIKLLGIAALFSMATLILCQPAHSIQPAAVDNSNDQAIYGIWRCEMHGLPAVTLTVTKEGGSLNGAVLFYLHRREAGQAETATPGVPEPLIKPRFDGQTFTFEVSHRRAHPPQTLHDAPVQFQLKLTSSDKGVLANLSENDPEAPVYEFVKSDY